ncbi:MULTISPECIES: DinB family protein [Bacillaceae]|uniref:DinB family protein n=1 Tax=Evansella alkalicola TaxID=745819 RepID=A0ABS6JXI3_9BACI|nr:MULTISPECIES: DinB family protein [Bacillaceae]MBU9723291.1 DinB family protein [Bacillus alkalicola]
MSEERNIIHSFGEFSTWLSTLEDLDETLWSKPISEGKWSVSEIVAHIMNWDHHLLFEVIPSVREGKGMEFPECDPFNKKASDYAKSGVSQAKLLKEVRYKRELLVKELHTVPTVMLNKPLTVNGETHCPHTGLPYSLIVITHHFIYHDQHHQKQITEFLEANTVV